MATKRVYSLCISIQKLRRLKNGKDTVVSHVCSLHWERFHNKNLNRVRFFDQNLLEDATFIVKETKKIIQMGECIIKIEVGKQIL